MLRVIAILLLAASPAATTRPVQASCCDGEAHEAEGERRLASGQFAAALAEFESALKCMSSEPRWVGAATAACRLYVVTKRSMLLDKANRYIERVTAENQQRLRDICNGVP